MSQSPSSTPPTEEERIDSILTATAESICGEWCDGEHEGSVAVSEHMSTERAALLALLAEARIGELSNVQLEHGNYMTQTFVNGQSMTIEERIADLRQLGSIEK
jgi:hypothetical protein